MIRVGDLVKLKTGFAEQEVTAVTNVGTPNKTYLKCRYVKSGFIDEMRPWRLASDYELVMKKGDSVSKAEKKNALYQTKSGEYGTFLARDSSGRMILEMKDEKRTVRPFEPGEVELVMPYTVLLRRNTGGACTHFETVAGTVEVGDVVLNDDGFWRVEKLDTRFEHEAPKLSGVILETRKIV